MEQEAVDIILLDMNFSLGVNNGQEGLQWVQAVHRRHPDIPIVLMTAYADVMKNIAFEKGVKDIVCSVEEQTVLVTYDANKTDIPTLQKAFAAINRPATLTPPNQAKSPATPCSGACHSH